VRAPTCANWLRYGVQPAGATSGMVPGHCTHKAGRVFVGAKWATLRRTNLRALWVEAVDKAGLPAGFRFHDLRHTGSTWAADSGANLRELMERMGRSSTRAALICLHGSRNGDRRNADGIGRQMAASAHEDKGDDDGDDGAAGVPARV
jgi:integrase